MDARRLDHKTLTELRKRAVMSVQKGESPEAVARILQISRQAMYGWLARYREGGWDNLDAKKRGGRRPRLDASAMKWVYDTVTMKNPLQLKFSFALWTSKMVGQAISKRFGITLSKASVCRLMGQLGLSPQRPLWRAYQQQPEAVEKWLNEEYPRIRELARTMKARVFFGDEAGVRSDHHAGTTWGVKGKTPVVTSTGSRFGLNMISAVTAQGEFRFTTVKGRVNAPQFLEFIKRLLHNADRPVFLIVDGHPVHKAKSIKTFAEANKDRFRLFHLPPYPPELNPDERVWNDLKNNTIGKKSIDSPEQLHKDVIGFLRLLQFSPSRVRSYFANETTRYAA
jgi:transposase